MDCANCGQALVDAASACDSCGAATPAPAGGGEGSATPIRVGEVLDGKWRLIKRLGRGGMGTVYLAHDLTLDRNVAVKLLAGELCGDAEFVARFEREARMTASFEHLNVVPIYAVGRNGNRPFIVMKKLEGKTLSAHLADRREGLGLAETQAIMRQLCAGLGFIHGRGCVHRDIKTGNIFIAPDGHVTLLDFGILRDNRTAALTRTGVMIGTPKYMSPEQIRAERNLDHRSDLYAAGVLLFELLTGKTPFDGEGEQSIFRQHLTAPPPDPSISTPGVPPAVGKVVQKALAKDPAERFQGADALYQALEAACAQAPAATSPAAAQPSQTVADDEASPGLFPETRAGRDEAIDEKARESRTLVPPQTHSPPAPERTMVGEAPRRDAADRPEQPEAADPPVERTIVGEARRAEGRADGGGLVEPKRPAGAPRGWLRPAALAAVLALLGGGALAWRSLIADRALKSPAGVAQAPPPLPPPEEVAAPAPPPPAEPVPVESPVAAPVEPPPIAKRRPAPAKPAAGGKGRLQVATTQGGEPFWARIAVDGRPRGESPVSLELPAGRHSVLIEREGFRAVTRDVEIRPGGTALVTVELTR